MPLFVIYNPVCGSGSAKSLVDNQVLPTLEKHNVTIDGVSATEYTGHAGFLVADYLKQNPSNVTIVLASGDGTLHEILNHILPHTSQTVHQVLNTLPRISFVLVPAGTANALYSSLFPPAKPGDITASEYRLQSLHAYLSGKDGIPLTLSVTTLVPTPGSREVPRIVISSVVTSTSLHAAILHDSEALRNEMPGIERFKVAAQQNSKRWYNASVKLLPSSSATVQIYDQLSHRFVNHPESTPENSIVELGGPFVYFLSTVNVDRLEPEFRITPLARALPSNGATCDIIIVRPLRDPSSDGDNIGARDQYIDKIWKVMGGAYADGAHVYLRYNRNGEVVGDGTGPLVVEYIRCGGWEWIPGDDDRAHLLCSDGGISTIEDGGGAVSLAIAPGADAGIMVYG
ncbi:hypothetical protein P691DRAFT_724602 [Macrolepiota fuliginosa MF-IS2]|uniref:DAGKc domain-containing protein n=1 Tax=Macrolepiota fuliginosa MF-IS2 TaxID=1400762 RepID=A0A9P5XKI5_9AGAR|nr:hypothetical protein P691DRAFT_724602 [Macrolepiota fuliginosa MF-IS2]